MAFNDLAKYFSYQNLLRIIATVEPIKTPILDNIFKQDTNNILPTVAYEVYDHKPQVLPGVAPGAASVPNGAAENGTFYIKEGINIRVSDYISAYELNMYKLVGGKGLQEKLQQKLQNLKDSIKRTREVLAAKALTGTINHKVVAENGATLDYQVTFGSTLSYTPAATWDDTANAKPFVDLRAIARQIESESGYTNVSIVFAGYSAMDALINYLMAQQGAMVSQLVTIQPYGRELRFGGFRIIEVNGSYTDVDGTTVELVPAKKICVVADDALFVEYFSAIDDIEAGLQAVPIFAKSYEEKDPSRQVIVAHSKPLPVVHVPKAVCWAQVVS